MCYVTAIEHKGPPFTIVIKRNAPDSKFDVKEIINGFTDSRFVGLDDSIKNLNDILKKSPNITWEFNTDKNSTSNDPVPSQLVLERYGTLYGVVSVNVDDAITVSLVMIGYIIDLKNVNQNIKLFISCGNYLITTNHHGRVITGYYVNAYKKSKRAEAENTDVESDGIYSYMTVMNTGNKDIAKNLFKIKGHDNLSVISKHLGGILKREFPDIEFKFRKITYRNIPIVICEYTIDGKYYKVGVVNNNGYKLYNYRNSIIPNNPAYTKNQSTDTDKANGDSNSSELTYDQYPHTTNDSTSDYTEPGDATNTESDNNTTSNTATTETSALYNSIMKF